MIQKLVGHKYSIWIRGALEANYIELINTELDTDGVYGIVNHGGDISADRLRLDSKIGNLIVRKSIRIRRYYINRRYLSQNDIDTQSKQKQQKKYSFHNSTIVGLIPKK